MTLDQLVKILHYAATAYDRELTEDIVTVYYDQLGNRDALAIGKAVRHHVANCPKFPTVADIRDAANTLARRVPDPELQRNLGIARKVREARKAGATPEQVDSLIEKLDPPLVPISNGRGPSTAPTIQNSGR